jgi:hypothetical protein
MALLLYHELILTLQVKVLLIQAFINPSYINVNFNLQFLT